MNLQRLFDELPSLHAAVSETPSFQALTIPGFDRYRVGRNAAGEAALLIDTTGDARVSSPPLRLHSLAVYHNIHCRVTEGRVTTTKALTVVWCIDSDSTLRSYFLSVLGPVVLELGRSPTPAMVSQAINGLVELFRALAQPPKKSVQGLWSELFVIATARNPMALVRSWHAIPNERYDFHAGYQRLEVKSAASTVRRHRFVLEQLRPPAGTEVWIASVLVAHAVGGTSLRELLDRVSHACAANAAAQSHLHDVVATTLGNALTGALDERFDEQMAADSKRLYDHRDVPAIGGDIPSAISDVRFIADLSNVAPLTKGATTSAAGFFGAV
jgi:hypothetical protein